MKTEMIQSLATSISSLAARERADRIRAGLESLAPDILAAWQARDWIALGYSSWHEYVVGEFGGPLRLGREERKQVVTDMRDAGMSTRAIGTALGVSQMTALRDSEPVTNVTPHPVDEEETSIPIIWHALTAVMDSVDDLLLSDASALAAAVPSRRRATTAKKLRKLGAGLGRIAWNLEGTESSDD